MWGLKARLDPEPRTSNLEPEFLPKAKQRFVNEM